MAIDGQQQEERKETREAERETPSTVARMRRIVSHIGGGGDAVIPPLSSSSPSPLVPPHIPRDAPTRWNGWGYEDTKLFVNADGDIAISGARYGDVFHGAHDRVLPMLRPWAERVIGLDVRRQSPAVNQSVERFTLQEPSLSERQQQELAQFVKVLEGTHGVRLSTARVERVRHSHGQTCQEIYALRHAASLGRIPDVVVWPTSHEQVVHVVQEATARNASVCLIPHGGGTNVSSALECNPLEARAIVSMDMRAMTKILAVDRDNMTIRVEAGITGLELHERLRHRALTLGHEPDSWEFSTLGGWVATRASGMKKNVYGNIEDLVVNMRVVTPRGVLERAASVPRVSMGPDVQHAVIGSEGILGVVTEVTLRVRAYPACQKYDSFVFPSFAHGVAAMRDVMRERCVPASIRLMDNTQFQLGQALKPRSDSSSAFAGHVLDYAKKFYVTKVRGFNVDAMSAATVLLEGTDEEVARQHRAIQEIAKRHHGLSGGAESGQRGYFFTYIIAYLRDFALDYYFLSESFETAVPWSNVSSLITDIQAAIRDQVYAHPQRCAAPPLIACRVTQLYDTGVTVYVYYGINYRGVDDPLALFHAVEAAAVRAIVTNGGSLSHHHGIGKHRRDWLPAAISSPGVAMIRGLKTALDPDNVFAADNLFKTRSNLQNSE